MTPTRCVLAICLSATFAASGVSTEAQPMTLGAVLERAADYVTTFQRQLAGVVAEAVYTQDLHDQLPSGTTPRGPVRNTPLHRQVKSDLLLVKPEEADRWIQFRDTFEVDGHPVRDRSERLMKLFVEPTAATADQAEQIVTESARYNIGNVMRTINVPVFALLILDPQRREHFKFTRVGSGSPTIAGDLKMDDGVWVV